MRNFRKFKMKYFSYFQGNAQQGIVQEELFNGLIHQEEHHIIDTRSKISLINSRIIKELNSGDKCFNISKISLLGAKERDLAEISKKNFRKYGFF